MLERVTTQGLFYRETIGGTTVARLFEEAAERYPAIAGDRHADALDSYAFAQAIQYVLHALPFTLPQALADDSDRFLCVGHGDVSGVISLATSGTSSASGKGKRIFCTENDLQCTADFFRHGMQYMVSPEKNDHVALMMSGERSGSVGQLLQRGLEALGVPCSVPGFVGPAPEDSAAMLEALHKDNVTCLVGVPGQVLRLARTSGARGILSRLHTVLLSGDTATHELRRGIAEVLQCEVFVHYGLTETGLGGAVECKEHSGCHVREADLLVEIVNDEGNAVVEGAYGEIVLTTLTREAMPLIRYRTGDEGRILPGRCTCGSLLRRIEVRGRISERIPLPRGGYLHAADLESLLYSLPFVVDYTAELYIEPLPCLVLRIDHEAESDGSALAGITSLLDGHASLCLFGQCAIESRLPVYLDCRKSGNGLPNVDTVRQTQAKKSIRRMPGPFRPI